MPRLDAAAEHDDRAGVGEVAVHAVVFGQRHDVGRVGLILDFLADLAFGDDVAAELAGEDDERAVEQAALFEIENELGDRGVDLALHVGGALVAVFVGVPVAEGDVFGGDFDEAGAGFDEAAGEEAALSEAAVVVGVEAFFRLEREVEGFGGGRGEQAIRGVEGADQGFALEVAAVLLETGSWASSAW